MTKLKIDPIAAQAILSWVEDGLKDNITDDIIQSMAIESSSDPAYIEGFQRGAKLIREAALVGVRAAIKRVK